MCPRCWKLQEVIEIVTPYGWHCETCHVRRSYNGRRLACEKGAIKHHRENPTHKVIASNLEGKILWASHPTSHEQLELAYGHEDPPF